MFNSLKTDDERSFLCNLYVFNKIISNDFLLKYSDYINVLFLSGKYKEREELDNEFLIKHKKELVEESMYFLKYPSSFIINNFEIFPDMIKIFKNGTVLTKSILVSTPLIRKHMFGKLSQEIIDGINANVKPKNMMPARFLLADVEDDLDVLIKSAKNEETAQYLIDEICNIFTRDAVKNIFSFERVLISRKFSPEFLLENISLIDSYRGYDALKEVYDLDDPKFASVRLYIEAQDMSSN